MASMESPGKPENLGPVVHLNRREKQVLALIGKGMTSKEIADVLHITVTTVDSHRKQIRQKLKLHNTAALVSYAAHNSRKHKE